MLHQTAALIVYPAVLAYSALNGSTDGLFLFLRVLFLIGSVVSAAVWILFLLRIHHRIAAWAGGALVLAFIPFGLPAPSYNTLGLQALTCALAFFGCAALDVPKSRRQVCALLASVSAWAVATVAYPPLVIPFAFLCVLGLLDQRRFPQQKLYLAVASTAICVAWAIVVAALSFQRLHDSAIYHASISDAGGLGRKVTFAVDLLRANPLFAILCVAALAIGVVRQRLGPHLTALASASVIAGLFLSGPVLFARSHDAITLATLTGVGLLLGFRRDADPEDRAIALVYATSVVAALTTSVTAYNSIFNFCIGAVPAAALALVGRPSSGRSGWIGALPAASAIAAVLSTSLLFYYGELPDRAARERIHDGFFAGIAAHPDDINLLRLMRDNVNPILVELGGTAAVLGRLPGIILASPARLKMPFAFPLVPTTSEEGLAKTRSFYAHLQIGPRVVLVYRDPYFEPINPFPGDPERFDACCGLQDSFGPPGGVPTPLGAPFMRNCQLSRQNP